ncbi:MAG TPA: hypothetical protein VHX39_24410 [Acetobacteraceae bacterium]|jgi:hypothetical protein|nr:hypothetical protein [Acetobacteraceae bacterium]
MRRAIMPIRPGFDPFAHLAKPVTQADGDRKPQASAVSFITIPAGDAALIA